MRNKTITLKAFNEGDFSSLIDMIPDARFLLQWAGPKYTYPLDTLQLKETLTKTIGEYPSFAVYKAVCSRTFETLGHIQLLNIDNKTATCTLGRVLIFPKHENQGYGKIMINLAIKEAFDTFRLNEVKLNVFDFNKKAIAVYRSMGFIEYQFKENARHYRAETWNLVSMKLNRKHWVSA